MPWVPLCPAPLKTACTAMSAMRCSSSFFRIIVVNLRSHSNDKWAAPSGFLGFKIGAVVTWPKMVFSNAVIRSSYVIVVPRSQQFWHQLFDSMRFLPVSDFAAPASVPAGLVDGTAMFFLTFDTGFRLREEEEDSNTLCITTETKGCDDFHAVQTSSFI